MIETWPSARVALIHIGPWIWAAIFVGDPILKSGGVQAARGGGRSPQAVYGGWGGGSLSLLNFHHSGSNAIKRTADITM